MPPQRKNPALSIADAINVIAALIGIFGFLTGISSLPLILSNKHGVQTDTTWFFGSIPYSISIPVFVLTLIFVYGLYFVLIYRINRWLFLHGAIRRYRPDGLYPSDDTPSFYVIYGSRPGDDISMFFFVCFGSAIGWLITRAFFGISPEAIIAVIDKSSPLYNDTPTAASGLFAIVAIMFILLLNVSLCKAAKDSASIE